MSLSFLAPAKKDIYSILLTETCKKKTKKKKPLLELQGTKQVQFPSCEGTCFFSTARIAGCVCGFGSLQSVQSSNKCREWENLPAELTGQGQTPQGDPFMGIRVTLKNFPCCTLTPSGSLGHCKEELHLKYATRWQETTATNKRERASLPRSCLSLLHAQR